MRRKCAFASWAQFLFQHSGLRAAHNRRPRRLQALALSRPSWILRTSRLPTAVRCDQSGLGVFAPICSTHNDFFNHRGVLRL